MWELDAWAQPLIPLLAEEVHAARHKVGIWEAGAALPPVLWELSSEEALLHPDLCRLRNVLRRRLRRRRQRRLSSRRMRDCMTLDCTLDSLAARLRRSEAELSAAA